jgi:hypothetical protein
MVDVKTNAETVTFEVQGWDKVWSLTSKLTIPLAHIKSVVADPNPAMGWFQGLKIAGTDLPNVFRAGMFYQEGNRVFWDVRHPEKTIVVSLADERYARLIIEVEDPEFVVNLLSTAIAEASPN